MIGWHTPVQLHLSKEKLLPLLLGGSLRQVSLTLLGLFSPIYIYQSFQKITANQENLITLVLIFYLVLLAFKMISIAYSEDISQRVGFKGTIRLSLIPFLLFIPSLILGGSLPVVLLVSAAMLGIHEGLFWWGFHGYFVKVSDSKHFGLSIGRADLYLTSGAVITPFIGGLLANELGFNFIFILSLIFMIASLVVLGIRDDRKQRTDVKLKDIIALLMQHKAISIAYVGRGGELIIYGIFWPLYLYFIFNDVLELGIIISVGTMVAALFAILVGKITDKRGEKWAVTLGSPLTALSWLLRFMSTTPVYVLADSLRNFGLRLVGIPLDQLSYKKAREGTTGAAMLFRETALTVGSIAAVIVAIFLIKLGMPLSNIFVLGFAFAWLPLISVITKKI